MADLGGPIDQSASNDKFDRYYAAQQEYGISRWAVEDLDGTFLGYSGVMPRQAADHPLGPHYEVGWRFIRTAWGNGYATESARAALEHAIGEHGLRGIVSYTSADNLRSQSVMSKLQLVRAASSDFVVSTTRGEQLQVLVWTVPAIP